MNNLLRLENQLCFPIYAASRLITQAYGPYLRKMNITYPQYLVLMVLWEENGLTLKAIGEKLYLDSGTLTPLLRKMEKGKLLSRSKSPFDSREVLHFLSPKGANMQDKAAKMAYLVFCSSGLTPAKAFDLRASIKELVGHIG